MSDDKELEVQRLLCAMHPTRLERLLGWGRMKMWGVSERGVFGWAGDRFDQGERDVCELRAQLRVRARQRAAQQQ